VYIRNDNTTTVLAADVYRTGVIFGTLDLKAGPLGIVVPLRGVGQMSMGCKIKASSASLLVHGPRHVPDLVELPKQHERSPKPLPKP
jgi:hypothetical protein